MKKPIESYMCLFTSLQTRRHPKNAALSSMSVDKQALLFVYSDEKWCLWKEWSLACYLENATEVLWQRKTSLKILSLSHSKIYSILAKLLWSFKPISQKNKTEGKRCFDLKIVNLETTFDGLSCWIYVLCLYRGYYIWDIAVILRSFPFHLNYNKSGTYL